MLVPDEYKTGNKKMDEKIAKALLKDPITKNKMYDINFIQEPIKKARITVSDKELRTYKDGTLFASKGEMERWDYLLTMQRAGEIKDLERQVEFLLQEEFIHKQWGEVKHLYYVADFVYTNLTMRREYPDRVCVEDSKGKWLTDIYKIKKKLFLYKYGGLLFFEV